MSISQGTQTSHIYGTCYFVSLWAAVNYFGDYEDDPVQAVATKLREGSIKIGRPALKADETCFLNHQEGRWFVRVSSR